MNGMTNDPSRLQKLRAPQIAGGMPPCDLVEKALARANQNAGRNVYLSIDESWTLREAER